MTDNNHTGRLARAKLENAPPPTVSTSWARALPDALRYPFRLRCLWQLLFILFALWGGDHHRWRDPGNFYWVAAYLTIPAFLVFVLDLNLRHSAAGHLVAPRIQDWNSFTNDEVYGPFYTTLFAIALPAAPFLAYGLWAREAGEWHGGLGWTLALCAALYSPPAVFSASLIQGFPGLLPHRVVRVVRSAPLAWMQFTLLLLGAGALIYLLQVGHPLGLLVANLVSLYLLLVLTRLVGLIYWCHQEAYDWLYRE